MHSGEGRELALARRSALFEGLDDGVVADCLRHSSRRLLNPGERVVTNGERDRGVFLVPTGRLRASMAFTNGCDLVLTYRNAIFGKDEDVGGLDSGHIVDAQVASTGRDLPEYLFRGELIG